MPYEPPASKTRILWLGFSERRFATTLPAVPPPTTIKSNVRFNAFRSATFSSIAPEQRVETARITEGRIQDMDGCLPLDHHALSFEPFSRLLIYRWIEPVPPALSVRVPRGESGLVRASAEANVMTAYTDSAPVPQFRDGIRWIQWALSGCLIFEDDSPYVGMTDAPTEH